MRDRQAWKPYFEAIAARMRLGHWTIEVADGPPIDENALAAVNCWHGRVSATMKLSDGFLEDTPDEQRDTVVHELVHCYFAHPDKLIAGELFGHRYDSWRLATEYGIDTIAKVIAATMPMPDEVLGAETEPPK